MPFKFDGIPINNPNHDKRVKLTDLDRENIIHDYASGLFSQRDLAKKYNVSRRSIQFTLDPDKLAHAKTLQHERQKDGRYYSKEKQREYMKRHRDHKKNFGTKVY
jgi:hypothetical protein